MAGAGFGQGFGDQLATDLQQRRQGSQALDFLQSAFGAPPEVPSFEGPFSPAALQIQQQVPRTTPGMGQPVPEQRVTPGVGARLGQVNADVDALVAEAAQRHGVDPDTMRTIAMLESGGDPSARNPRSSAAGLFQFMPPTAEQYGLADPMDAAASADAGARLARDNARILQQRLGRPPTTGEMYLAHQQGAAGAAALLDNPDQNAASALQRFTGDSIDRARARIRANLPAHLQDEADRMTAGEFAEYWMGKAEGVEQGSRMERSAMQPSGSPFTQAMDQPQAEAPAAARRDPRRAIFDALQRNPALLADENFFGSVMAMLTPQEAAGGDPFTLSPGQVRFDAQGQPIAAAPDRPQQPGAQFRTLDPSEVQRMGFPPGAVVQMDDTTGRVNVVSDAPQGRDFGAGARGQALNMMAEMAPAFGAGALDAADDRWFRAAVTEYTQPREIRDPDTGLVQTIRPELPDFVTQALAERGMAPPPVERADPERPGQLPAEQLTDEQRQAREAELLERARGAPTAAQPGTAEYQPTTLPEDAILSPADMEFRQSTSLMHEAMRGNLSGPIPALGRVAERIPGLGLTARQMTEAGTLVPILRTRLVRALQTNPRYAVMEREDLNQMVDIDPATIDSPQSYVNRLVGTDRALAEIEAELTDVVGGSRELVSGETRQHAMDSLHAIRSFRSLMMPPRLSDRSEIEAFIEANPRGSQFTALDPDTGQWRIFSVD